jgi:DNA-binding response OmpR family regulator
MRLSSLPPFPYGCSLALSTGNARLPSVNHPKILLIDDDARLSSTIRAYLSESGRYVVREENEPSLAFTAAREFKPDIVVLDLDMPGKRGAEVAAELRADWNLRETPLIILSGIGPEHSRQVENAAFYLAKPCQLVSLIESIEILLKTRLAV